MKTSTLFGKVLSVCAALLAGVAFAQSQSVDSKGVALKGHDPVAYMTEGKPVQGMEKFMAKHDGATYHFSSEKNRDTFVSQPSRFAPQYGGFCAYGAAKGGKFDVDPAAFTVLDGKLYLNKNKDVQKLWTTDARSFIKQADQYWVQLSKN